MQLIQRIRIYLRQARSSQLRVNFVATAVTNAANVLVMLLAYPTYLHFLGYSAYGLWIILSTVIAFTQLTSFGMGSAVMTLVADAHARRDHDLVKQYVSSSTAVIGGIGAFAAVALVVARSYIVRLFGVDSADGSVLLALLPYAGLLTAYALSVQISTATLAGLGRMDLSATYDCAGRFTGLITSVVLLTRGFGISSLLMGNFLGYIVVHLLCWRSARRLAEASLLSLGSIRRDACVRVMRFGGGMFASSLVQMFLAPFNRVVLSRYAGLATLPTFDIAYNGAMQVRGLFESGFRAFVPKVSADQSRRERSGGLGQTAITRRARSMMFKMALPGWLILMAVCPIALRIWLGQRFVSTLPLPFEIMLGAAFVSLIGVPSFYLLVGLGKTREILVASIVQSALNVAVVASVLLCRRGAVSPAMVAVAAGVGMLGCTLYLLDRERSFSRTDN